MPIEPDPDQMNEMASRPANETIVMLNLLRFREQAEPGHGVDGLTGSQAYREYGRRFEALHPRFGGTPIWMGQGHATLIGEENESWDLAILVRYPSRQNFLTMLADPEYVAIAPIRAAALADSRLIEMGQLMMGSAEG